jgi:DNA processing protein
VTAAGGVAGFSDREIAELLAPIRAEANPVADSAARREAFADAVWSCLVEPGDATAGVLRLALGSAAALLALHESDTAVERRLRDAGVPDPARLGLEAARARWAPRAVEGRLRGAFRSARVLGVRLVVADDPEWPGGLSDLGAHGPAALWVRGDPGVLVTGPSVALVGCRAATAYGEQVAAELADGLVSCGMAVHSGGAYGIDGMAHRAALAADGTTAAVMAGGVDRLYPAGHHDLLSRIAARGAVISELPCGTSPSRWRFLQRNRILAAITAATVVVEAGHRSGALNTAGHAAALGRPLGVVPGPVTSPASAGCHRLLREGGAACVTGADDVRQLVAPTLDLGGDAGPMRLPPEQMRVLDALSSRRPRDEAVIASSSGLSVERVAGVLAVLELDGRAVEREGGWLRGRG